MLSGCASALKSGVEGQAAQVKVYGLNQLAQNQYDDVCYPS
jgi:hypothetical protein